MSHQVAQSSLIQKESTESDAGAVKDISHLPVEEEKEKVVIKASDLKMVMDATHLPRNTASALIEGAEGDIKKALKAYVIN